MEVAANPIEVFYSYAHEDDRLRKQLETHLSTLKRQGLIAGWNDRNISAGKEWKNEINTHLNTARLILLLISPAFIDSDYCYSIEMTRAMERHEAGEARVIPIILRPTDWKGVAFEKLDALPTDAKPITTWTNRDKALLDVAQGVRKAVEDINSKLAENGVSPHAVGSEFAPVRPWNVPYRRNPLFTGREDVLQQLHESFASHETRASIQLQAISGLGGVGKTQIALEYAYRYRDDYQVVLWAGANSRETLVGDFVKTAALLKLPAQSIKDQNLIVNAVKNWLQQHPGWLLILDNADDLKATEEFIPPEGKGHILLTTRAQATGPVARHTEIEKMEMEEAILLLLRRASIVPAEVGFAKVSPDDRTKAEEIVKAMDGLPLALDQAGAYIQETGSSLSDYLALYQIERKTFLEERGEFDVDHPESVTATWSLSFDKVSRANPAAADLLRACVFLAPDAIPLEILVDGAPELGPVLGPVAARMVALNSAIKELLKYSLIRRPPGANILAIHRLVQTVLKDRMQEDEQRQWAERVVRAVDRAFPDVEFKTWPRCERCLPHAQLCTELIKQWRLEFPAAARMLYHTGSYLQERAQYKQVTPLLQLALTIREKLLGPEHADIAQSLNGLAELYYAQGDYERARPLYQRALTMREKVLGPEHPDTASSLHNLAGLYYVQGKYKQAEPLIQQALAVREKVLGPEHADTAESLNSLASFYSTQGDYEQAKQLFQRSLAIREKVLGSDHPLTASSLSNLANLSSTQGEYEQAEQLYQRALAIYKSVRGPEHPDTSWSLYSLADLYYIQGKYEQAELLYQQALAIRERVLGPEHPDTAASLSGLADLYYVQGKYKQAEPLYLRALTIYENGLGPEYIGVANNLRALANLYYSQQKYEQAKSLYQRALAIYEKTLGPEHRNTFLTLNSLADAYYAQGKYEQAEPLYQRALAVREKVLGPEHLDTATTLNSLANVYFNQNKYEQAEPLYRQAEAIWEKALGPEHPDTVTGLNNLADAYYAQSKYEQAEPLYQRVLAIREKVPGSEDASTAASLNRLANIYHSWTHYEQAEPFYQRALAIYEKTLGPEHFYIAVVLDNYASLLRKMGREDEATKLTMRANAIREKGIS